MLELIFGIKVFYLVLIFEKTDFRRNKNFENSYIVNVGAL